jgi:predicted nucleic acid-binding Zn ribbon protein
VRKVRDPKPKKLAPARDLVAAVLAKSGFRTGDFPVFEAWDRALGPDAGKARAVGLKQGRLYVEVDSPVRQHGLTLRKRELLKKINAAFGGSAPVSDIIFRPGAPGISDDKHA